MICTHGNPGPLRAPIRMLAAALVTAACSGSGAERPRVEYDPESGRLRRIEYDATGNGRRDAAGIMDGARIQLIELDADENGRVERWDFYGPDNRLEKVGLSRRNDGVLDAQAFYSSDGALQRIEISTRRDGRFDRVEFYERAVLVRSEEDRDRDGRPDKWETYRYEPGAARGEPAYVITSAAFDDLGRGTPQRRLIYGRRGGVVRLEIDPEGDGRFVVDPR